MAPERCAGLGLLLIAVMQRWRRVSTLAFLKINDYHSHIVCQNSQGRYSHGKALR